MSPLAPKSFPAMPVIKGVDLGVARTGIKYKGRPDLLTVRLAKGTQGAGVMTRSAVIGAPVEWCRQVIDKNTGKDGAGALVVNAGNANVFTGKQGRETVKATAAIAAELVGCRQKDVLISSTGVIGEALETDKLIAGTKKAFGASGRADWQAAASAIMTTDTFAKGAFARTEIDGQTVQICGIAKGSGMVAPDMGTMLAYIFTDATIPAPILQTLLAVNVRDTFNAITVDSDMSTSDTVLLFATGQIEHKPVRRAGAPRLLDFRKKLVDVMTDLACQVVRDGEGAAKFITVKVCGAANARAAKAIAMSIGNSPLVKTAIAGGDANWGRIVMAVGKSGQKIDVKKLRVKIGGVSVAKGGAVDPTYKDAQLHNYLNGTEIEIEIDVGVGKGEAVIWTCDLTHDYISINADYRS